MKSFVVHVKARSDTLVNNSNGYMLYSALCSLTKSTALDKVFHPNESAQKPFSLSPLFETKFEKGEIGSFKISFINDASADEFLNIVQKNIGERFRVGTADFSLYSISLPGEHEYALSMPVEIMFRKSLSCGFKFVSATGFKRAGKQFFLPLPELVFGSLAEKWRLFIDENAWKGSDFSQIEMNYYRIESKALRLGSNRIMRGFVGEVEFSLNSLTEEMQIAACALAGFAFFSGVGYKTTQGMGCVLPFFRE